MTVGTGGTDHRRSSLSPLALTPSTGTGSTSSSGGGSGGRVAPLSSAKSRRDSEGSFAFSPSPFTPLSTDTPTATAAGLASCGGGGSSSPRGPAADRRGGRRRMSLGELPQPTVGRSRGQSEAAPPRMGGLSFGGMSAIEGLRQRFVPRGRDSGSIGNSRRFGMDITGLRKALLIRVLGVDVGRPGQHKRRLSTGSISSGWLRHRPSIEGDNPNLLIWILDVESGHDWKASKSATDLIALNEVCNALRPGLGGDFPLKRSRGDAAVSALALTAEKQQKLEKYLRRLASMILDASPSASSYAVSKTLQDFLGATERSEMLTELQHRSGDVARQLVQVYACDVLRSSPSLEERLVGYTERVLACDVERSDVLGSLSAFIGETAADVMREHGDRLRSIVEVTRPKTASPLSSDEADALCLAALRRLIEAEVFVPLVGKVNEKLAVGVDKELEAKLAAKVELFKSRPQSAFGIPLSHISISSWETSVQLLRRLGEGTMLPSDKLDVLVGAVKEVHATFKREHPRESALGADDFLPIMIYILVQAGVQRLLAIKTLLSALCDPARLLSEAGYCVATLEAAADFLLNVQDHDDIS